VAGAAGEPKAAANWVMGDLMGALNAEGKEIADSPVTPERLGELVALIRKGEISGKIAKEVFAKMLSSGEAAPAIVEREGLQQISDSGALAQICLLYTSSWPELVWRPASFYRSWSLAGSRKWCSESVPPIRQRSFQSPPCSQLQHSPQATSQHGGRR